MEPPPTDEQVVTFAKMLGSYIGEVFRRNHGGEWGMVTFGGESIPGLRAIRTEHLFSPMAKVQKRLVNGFGDNVWHYYQSLLQSHRRDMRWWRRWRRWLGSTSSG